MNYWTVMPEWLDETVFILGGGPSMAAFSPMALRGRGRVIAINDAYRLYPTADVLYFCDKAWWERSRAGVQGLFKGRYVISMDAGHGMIPGVHMLRCTGVTGLETDPGALRHGCNSGYQAINLAYHFGAKRIVLIGYDMKVAPNGWSHWFGHHPGQTAAGFTVSLGAMLPNFPTLVQPLQDAGVTVINACPGSALTCWPLMTLDDALEAVSCR